MNTKELLKRYDIGRSAFMNRLAKLNGFELSKDSNGHNFANDEQLATLDDLDQHLKRGGRIEDFAIASPVTVDSVRRSPGSNGQLAVKPSNNEHLTPSDSTGQPVLDLAILAEALAKRIDPLSHYKQLEWAIANKVKLSTKEVQSLIGVKPHGETFDRGSYRFVRSGKIGSQGAWLVDSECHRELTNGKC